MLFRQKKVLRSNKVMKVSVKILLTVCIGVAFYFGVIYQFTSYLTSQNTVWNLKRIMANVSSNFQSNKDQNLDPILQKAQNNAQKVVILEKTEKVLGVDMFYRETMPLDSAQSAGSVLLLHGQSFTSKNWVDIKTMQIFAAAGYHVIAVDLPGYGKSSKLATGEKKLLVEEICSVLNLERPVVVSPSMSGMFSLPALMSKPELFRGYAPVAPVGTGHYTNEQYGNIKVPTLIVYGSRDTGLGSESLKNLSHLKHNQKFEIEDAGHACYLDKPQIFHTALLKFLLELI